MQRVIRTVIIEDDPYARDTMALLLRRDWRTQVTGEIGQIAGLEELIHNEKQDLIVLDTEHPQDPHWIEKVTRAVLLAKTSPRILCTGTFSDVNVLTQLDQPIFCGYILKGEIAYALAWAVVQAAQGNWVMTPSTRQTAEKIPFHPLHTMTLDGQRQVPGLTRREAEMARLAILFNMRRANLADDMNIQYSTISEYVNQIYEKLGLHDIQDGSVEPDSYFSGQTQVLDHFRDSLEHIWQDGRKKKAPDMDTLAFHLLTIPEVVDE
jgi:DNA-binding NarL/FixJ family response regulator